MISSLKILLMILCCLAVSLLLFYESAKFCTAVGIDRLWAFGIFSVIFAGILVYECWRAAWR